MRLWSLHPKYLDQKGLVALWREGLGALAVLRREQETGGTVGYSNHPQLLRFRATPDPIRTLQVYLLHVWREAGQRGFKFDLHKLGAPTDTQADPMVVTTGQLNYELSHLNRKLERRCTDGAHVLSMLELELRHGEIEPHPMFRIGVGDVADWERVIIGGSYDRIEGR